jgi:hypothetical protein
VTVTTRLIAGALSRSKIRCPTSTPASAANGSAKVSVGSSRFPNAASVPIAARPSTTKSAASVSRVGRGGVSRAVR